PQLSDAGHRDLAVKSRPVTWSSQSADYAGREDWKVDSGWLDAQGNRTNGIHCNSAAQSPLQCATDAGYRGNYLAYQPADRFWTFQWIETGIYLAISALALALTFWLVRRRLA